MPPAKNEIEIIIRNLRDCPINPDLFLTTDDKKRLNKINSIKSRYEFISSHSLLNCTLSSILNIPASSLRLSYNTHGKPYLDHKCLKKNNQELFFSLSHSKEKTALAISTAIETGLDIEQTSTRNLHSCLRLARRYYHPTEQEYIHSTKNEHKQLKRFYKIWTLKESYLKAIGTGINIELKSLCFTINYDTVHLWINNIKQNNVFFYLLDIQEYILALSYIGEQKRTIKINQQPLHPIK